MTDHEKLIYLAGILDGEGCLRTYIVTNGRKEKHRIPILAVTQKDIKLLEWLKLNYQGYIHKNGNCFQWQLRNKNAVNLIAKVQPYLIVKAEDAKRFLTFICEFCPASMSSKQYCAT